MNYNGTMAEPALDPHRSRLEPLPSQASVDNATLTTRDKAGNVEDAGSGLGDAPLQKPTRLPAVNYEDRYLQQMRDDLQRLQAGKEKALALSNVDAQKASTQETPGDASAGKQPETQSAESASTNKASDAQKGHGSVPENSAPSLHALTNTSNLPLPQYLGNPFHMAAAQQLLASMPGIQPFSPLAPQQHQPSYTGLPAGQAPVMQQSPASFFGPYGTFATPSTAHVARAAGTPPGGVYDPLTGVFTPGNALAPPLTQPPATSPTQQLYGATATSHPAAAASASSPHAQSAPSSQFYMQQRNVYISGLPESFRPTAFRSMCEVFGRITSSKLCMQGENADRCKGYGFVLYRDVESASTCIATLNGKMLQGKPLQVRRADLTAAPQPLDEVLPAAVTQQQQQQQQQPSVVPPTSAAVSAATSHMLASHGITSPLPGVTPVPGLTSPSHASQPSHTTGGAVSPVKLLDTSAAVSPSHTRTDSTADATKSSTAATTPTATGDLARTVQEQQRQLHEQQLMIQQLLQLQQQQQQILMSLGLAAPLALPSSAPMIPSVFPGGSSYPTTPANDAATTPATSQHTSAAPPSINTNNSTTNPLATYLPASLPAAAPGLAAASSPTASTGVNGFFPGTVGGSSSSSSPAAASPFIFAPGVMNMTPFQQQQMLLSLYGNASPATDVSATNTASTANAETSHNASPKQATL